MPDERRRLRQQLESLSRAGLTFIPRRDPGAVAPFPAAATVSVPVLAPPPAPHLPPPKAAMPQSQPAVSGRPLSHPAKAKSPPAGRDDKSAPGLFQSAPGLGSPAVPANLADRQQALALL